MCKTEMLYILQFFSNLLDNLFLKEIPQARREYRDKAQVQKEKKKKNYQPRILYPA